MKIRIGATPIFGGFLVFSYCFFSQTFFWSMLGIMCFLMLTSIRNVLSTGKDVSFSLERTEKKAKIPPTFVIVYNKGSNVYYKTYTAAHYSLLQADNFKQLPPLD